MVTNKNLSEINSQYGKIPPQAPEVEEAVLGSLMLERDAYISVADIIDTRSFYKEEHKKIFEVIKYLSTHEKPVDLLMVTQELKNRNLLDEVGGPMMITKLTSRVASAAHIEFHSRIIAQKFMQREMIRVSTEIQTKAYDDTIDVDDLIYYSEKAIDDVVNKNGTVDTGTPTISVIAQACKEIELDCQNTAKGRISGITTGFRTLDDFIGGWKPGTLTIIASRPGIGKTSLALHFAKIAALNKCWVNFFSMEMSTSDLVKILISGQSGVNRSKIRDGKLDVNDWDKMNRSIGKLESLSIVWNDRAGINVNQIKAAIRKNKKAGRCDLVVLDYLQLVAPTDKKLIREQQIAEISRILKEITLNENIPVICLSQLNREAENEEPKPSHLRESGAIEQDADIILLPWRPGYNGHTANGQPIPENEIKMIIGKNRRGRRGSFKIYANEEMTQFSEDQSSNQINPF
jgi:replicative DNA helicase